VIFVDESVQEKLFNDENFGIASYTVLCCTGQASLNGHKILIYSSL